MEGEEEAGEQEESGGAAPAGGVGWARNAAEGRSGGGGETSVRVEAKYEERSASEVRADAGCGCCWCE